MSLKRRSSRCNPTHDRYAVRPVLTGTVVIVLVIGDFVSWVGPPRCRPCGFSALMWSKVRMAAMTLFLSYKKSTPFVIQVTAVIRFDIKVVSCAPRSTSSTFPKFHDDGVTEILTDER